MLDLVWCVDTGANTGVLGVRPTLFCVKKKNESVNSKGLDPPFFIGIVIKL